MTGSTATPGPEAEPPAGVLGQDALDRIQRYFADWNAALFESSMEFTNKMSFVGYTGGFTGWILLKGFLTPAAMDWVGIMLMISLATFVGWNVFNMIWLATQRFRYLVQLKGVLGDQVRQRHMELEAETSRTLATRYLPAWIVVLVVCITTAAIAFGIMIVTASVNLLELSV